MVQKHRLAGTTTAPRRDCTQAFMRKDRRSCECGMDPHMECCPPRYHTQKQPARPWPMLNNYYTIRPTAPRHTLAQAPVWYPHNTQAYVGIAALDFAITRDRACQRRCPGFGPQPHNIGMSRVHTEEMYRAVHTRPPYKLKCK